MKPSSFAVIALTCVLYSCSSPNDGRARRFTDLAFPAIDAMPDTPGLAIPADGTTSAIAFIEALYGRYESRYFGIRSQDYERMCDDLALDPDDVRTRGVLRVFFLHDLLTSSSSKNGERSGSLGIPYYWHWVDPNPRHALVDVGSGETLSRIPPPTGFERYKSFADVDRVPTLYLGDLFSNDRWYNSGSDERFPTFGWCSEREMAFAALAAALGHHFWIVKRNGQHGDMV